MDRVVLKPSELHVLLANRRRVRGTVGILVHSVPKAEVGAAGGVVVDDRVVRVRHPVGGWG